MGRKEGEEVVEEGVEGEEGEGNSNMGIVASSLSRSEA
tara:strand:- start:971 stop:1084 length:114 start_codon:yes stop_codon:yes gene_type:complete